jgi:hypothetical protein
MAGDTYILQYTNITSDLNQAGGGRKKKLCEKKINIEKQNIAMIKGIPLSPHQGNW